MDIMNELRYLMKATQKESDEAYRKMLAPLDITPNQNEVLKILTHQDGLSISGIGDCLICGSDSPSRVIQRLIIKNYVRKETDSLDTRKTVIFITESGKDILKKSEKIEQEFNESIKLSLEEQLDIELLIAVLNKQVTGSKSHQQILHRKKLSQ